MDPKNEEDLQSYVQLLKQEDDIKNREDLKNSNNININNKGGLKNQVSSKDTIGVRTEHCLWE